MVYWKSKNVIQTTKINNEAFQRPNQTSPSQKNHSAILFEMNWQQAKEVVKAKTEETGVFMLKFW